MGEEQQRLLALLPRAAELRAEAFRHCRNAAQVEAELLDRLAYLERSSSLAECINSKLRPLQAIKKFVNQSFLNLFALRHSLTPIERSEKRAGKSPYEMLGLRLEGDEEGFVGVILAAARREGWLEETSAPCAPTHLMPDHLGVGDLCPETMIAELSSLLG